MVPDPYGGALPVSCGSAMIGPTSITCGPSLHPSRPGLADIHQLWAEVEQTRAILTGSPPISSNFEPSSIGSSTSASALASISSRVPKPEFRVAAARLSRARCPARCPGCGLPIAHWRGQDSGEVRVPAGARAEPGRVGRCGRRGLLFSSSHRRVLQVAAASLLRGPNFLARWGGSS